MPDPSNYDNESDWMSACVPAVVDEGKPHDQAVAQCMQMWRDRDKKAAPPSVDRAWSMLTVKSVNVEQREIEGTASTPTVDRVGDVVEPLGAKFDLPMPLLHHHRHDHPVGTVTAARATKDGITIKAKFAQIVEPGPLKDRIDTAWQEVKAGLIRGLSIGFRPLEYEILEEKTGGLRFTSWSWYELSLVTVPAQQDAKISLIKSLDADLLAASGNGQEGSATGGAQVAPSARPGASGKPPINLKSRRTGMSKTVAEQIAALEAKRAANEARMAEIMQKAVDEGRSTDEAEREDFDTLEAEVETLDGDLKRFRALEKSMKAKAQPVSNGEIKTAEDASNARAGYIRVKAPDLPPGIRFARVCKALGIARGNLVGAVQVAESLYPEDTPIHNVLKAAVAAGSTTNQPWAGALVSAEGAVFAEFLEHLRPQTILGKFGTGGIPALRSIPFRVPIGSQTSGGAASWVGEGIAKPLTYFEVAKTSLEPLKVAAIVVVTEELLRYASMPAEQWLRDQLVAALRERLDLDFIDPAITAIPGTRPASITNGVSTVTSSGSSADAVRADVAAVMGNFIAANNLATSSVWIMDANTALRVSMMTNTLGQTEDFARNLSMAGGTFAGIPVIVSEYVGEFAGSPGASYVWLVAADQVFLGDEGGFNVDLSREASLLMDTAPTMSSGGVGSPDAPVGAQLVSMYQTNSVALRAERTISWVKARASAVQGISNVQWGT
jgi:HK97 family phage major capsid protein/HK97 family phage prohead protease